MTKHIKLFEQYSEEYDHERELLESIYEDWKIEQDDLDEYTHDYEDVYEDDGGPDEWDSDKWDSEDPVLTGGERAALKRGFQITSKPQMAALFLAALGNIDKDPGKYLVMVDGIEPFGEKDRKSMVFNITVPALADAIGLDSVRTAQRTISKFSKLLKGNIDKDETSGDILYKKIINTYRNLSQKNTREVAMLAAMAIQNPEFSVKHREAAKAEAKKLRSVADRPMGNQDQLRLGERVYSLIQSLKKLDAFRKPGEVGKPDKAERSAIDKLANELGLDASGVQLAYNKFRSDRDIR